MNYKTATYKEAKSKYFRGENVQMRHKDGGENWFPFAQIGAVCQIPDYEFRIAEPDPNNLTREQADEARRNGQKVFYRRQDKVTWDYILNASDPASLFDFRQGVEFRLTNPDPYAELKAAHAAGKVIQFNRVVDGWVDLHTPGTFDGSLPPDRYRIKPEPAPLKIEAGKSYRTREGRKATIALTDMTGAWPIVGYIEDREGALSWTEDGFIFASTTQDTRDIIAEWTDAPTPYDNWQHVPAWAKWQAMDKNGAWNFFESKPQQLDGETWGNRRPGRGRLPTYCYPANFSSSWENSCQKRSESDWDALRSSKLDEIQKTME